jgi:hypothetical protein
MILSLLAIMLAVNITQERLLTQANTVLCILKDALRDGTDPLSLQTNKNIPFIHLNNCREILPNIENSGGSLNQLRQRYELKKI